MEGLLFGIIIAVLIGSLVAVWVQRDAIERGVETPGLWAAAMVGSAVILGLLGLGLMLLVYLLLRPDQPMPPTPDDL